MLNKLSSLWDHFRARLTKREMRERSSRINRKRVRRAFLETLETRRVMTVALFDPDPQMYSRFGETVVPLSNGNVVVTAPNYNRWPGNSYGCGAVYLFNGETGALISSLVGGEEDALGSGGIVPLTNGNFVILSPQFGTDWQRPASGAITWVNGTTGLEGKIDETNSLIGTTPGDSVGMEVLPLANGNFVVKSRFRVNNNIRGAATFASGTVGIHGAISAQNSFITEDNRIEIITLANSNYVVSSRDAVTWVDGNLGLTGSSPPAQQSLTGLTQHTYDFNKRKVVEVGDSNYVVVTNRTATWRDGDGPGGGVISPSNSLVATSFGDNSITVLADGNYAVSFPQNKINDQENAGSVTWADGNTAISGEISPANSLVGGVNDRVGSGGVTALADGDFVVSSPLWNGAGALEVGAVTWASSTTGRTGFVSEANSLVGSSTGDQVGSGGVVELTNGHYVVSSPSWDRGLVADAGAVTWARGDGNSAGEIDESNSLIGATSNDQIGTTIYPLTNGNYVVYSPYWSQLEVPRAGAVTWQSGLSTAAGVVDPSNSLVGTSTDDLGPKRYGNSSDGLVNRVVPLTNGNYVISAPSWDNGVYLDAGAAIWADGDSGIQGFIQSTNSLYGTDYDDRVGDEVTPLTNGNYVVSSGSAAGSSYSGAVTWANGETGMVGTVNSLNSVVGGEPTGQIARGIVAPLPNGSFIFTSPQTYLSYPWSTPSTERYYSSAASWIDGEVGLTGVIASPSKNHALGNDYQNTQSGGYSIGDITFDSARERFFVPFMADGVIRVGSFTNGFSTPEGPTLSATISNGRLTIADVSNSDTPNRLHVRTYNADQSYFEVLDQMEGFADIPVTSPPIKVLNGGRRLLIPKSLMPNGMTVSLGGGDDIAQVSGYVYQQTVPPVEVDGGSGNDFLQLSLTSYSTVNYLSSHSGESSSVSGTSRFTNTESLRLSGSNMTVNLPTSPAGISSLEEAPKYSGTLTHPAIPPTELNSGTRLIPGNPSDVIQVGAGVRGEFFLGRSNQPWGGIEFQGEQGHNAGISAYAGAYIHYNGYTSGVSRQGKLNLYSEGTITFGPEAQVRTTSNIHIRGQQVTAASGSGNQFDSSHGSIYISTDRLDLGTSSITAATTVSIRPLTAGSGIEVGPGHHSDFVSLTGAQVNRIHAPMLILGNASTGDIRLYESIHMANPTQLQLQSATSIQLLGSKLNSSGGNVKLTAPSIVAATPGADLVTGSGTVSFGAGSKLTSHLQSSLPDRDYQQFKIEGQLNLTGLAWNATGLPPAVVDELVIVDNDGSDPIVGTFQSMPEGSIVLVNGLRMRISYVAGDGNDVVLRTEIDPSASLPLSIQIASGLSVAAGDEISIPISISSLIVPATFASTYLLVYFDENVLNVLGVEPGSVLTNAFETPVIASRVTPGRVAISVQAAPSITGVIDGTLAYLRVRVKPHAQPGEVSLNLAANSTIPQHATELNRNVASYFPAPTDRGDDVGIDGKLTILAGPQTVYPEEPTVLRQGNYLQVSGTSGNDRIYVSQLESGLIRVRVNHRLYGDFSVPQWLYVDGEGGSDYLYLDPRLEALLQMGAGEAFDTQEASSRDASTGEDSAATTTLSQRDWALLDLLNEQAQRRQDEPSSPRGGRSFGPR